MQYKYYFILKLSLEEFAFVTGFRNISMKKWNWNINNQIIWFEMGWDAFPEAPFRPTLQPNPGKRHHHVNISYPIYTKGLKGDKLHKTEAGNRNWKRNRTWEQKQKGENVSSHHGNISYSIYRNRVRGDKLPKTETIWQNLIWWRHWWKSEGRIIFVYWQR